MTPEQPANLDLFAIAMEMKRFPAPQSACVDFFGMSVHDVGSLIEELGTLRIKVERLRYMDSLEIQIRKLRAELDTVTAERDLFRKECVALVNDCIAAPDRLSAQGGEVPRLNREILAGLLSYSPGDGSLHLPDSAHNINKWIHANYRPAPPHPDTVEVSREAYRWIPVGESLPEDQERVGFIVDCGRDDFLHGRVYGGSFNRRDWDERWGGFNTHGFGARASHWCRLPPIPDALRSSAQAQPSDGEE